MFSIRHQTCKPTCIHSVPNSNEPFALLSWPRHDSHECIIKQLVRARLLYLPFRTGQPVSPPRRHGVGRAPAANGSGCRAGKATRQAKNGPCLTPSGGPFGGLGVPFRSTKNRTSAHTWLHVVACVVGPPVFAGHSARSSTDSASD